eukprot:3187678-Amphidinium_carterae.1
MTLAAVRSPENTYTQSPNWVSRLGFMAAKHCTRGSTMALNVPITWHKMQVTQQVGKRFQNMD